MEYFILFLAAAQVIYAYLKDEYCYTGAVKHDCLRCDGGNLIDFVDLYQLHEK